MNDGEQPNAAFKLAWDKWLASEEGQRCAETDTLSTPYHLEKYLQNRLWLAFAAGWNGHSAEALHRRWLNNEIGT